MGARRLGAVIWPLPASLGAGTAEAVKHARNRRQTAHFQARHSDIMPLYFYDWSKLYSLWKCYEGPPVTGIRDILRALRTNTLRRKTVYLLGHPQRSRSRAIDFDDTRSGERSTMIRVDILPRREECQGLVRRTRNEYTFVSFHSNFPQTQKFRH